MEEKHPIDKLFSDGLSNPDIPFDEDAWTALSQKMHPRKRWPLIIWIGSGVAAAVVIAVLILSGEREPLANDPTRSASSHQPAMPPTIAPPTTDSAIHDTRPAPKAANRLQSTGGDANSQILPAIPPVLVRVQSQRMTSGTDPVYFYNKPLGTAMSSLVQPFPIHSKPVETPLTATSGTPQRGWTLGIMAAPDLSGTQPFQGKLSSNIGLMATYRLNGRFSISAGALYAKKLYQSNLANYRPGNPVYSQYTPLSVDADCDVLDIPVNINVDILRQRQTTWFASTGISSYLMLKETYDYTYPPHQYGDPKRLTLRNQNRHVFGVANLSVGYRRQLGGGISVTVQPFVKVPLTGIGNGNIKLYSSGVALSADINLSQRAKR